MVYRHSDSEKHPAFFLNSYEIFDNEIINVFFGKFLTESAIVCYNHIIDRLNFDKYLKSNLNGEDLHEYEIYNVRNNYNKFSEFSEKIETN